MPDQEHRRQTMTLDQIVDCDRRRACAHEAGHFVVVRQWGIFCRARVWAEFDPENPSMRCSSVRSPTNGGAQPWCWSKARASSPIRPIRRSAGNSAASIRDRPELPPCSSRIGRNSHPFGPHEQMRLAATWSINHSPVVPVAARRSPTFCETRRRTKRPARVAGALTNRPGHFPREEMKSMSRRRAAVAMMLALCLVLIESAAENGRN